MRRRNKPIIFSRYAESLDFANESFSLPLDMLKTNITANATGMVWRKCDCGANNVIENKLKTLLLCKWQM